MPHSLAVVPTWRVGRSLHGVNDGSGSRRELGGTSEHAQTITSEASRETELVPIQSFPRPSLDSLHQRSARARTKIRRALEDTNSSCFPQNEASQNSPDPESTDVHVIVTVHVRPDNPRHFGFSSRQRTTRTRGVITRCRKGNFAGIRSGSGESWLANFRRRPLTPLESQP